VRLPRALVKQAKHYAVDVERDFQDIVADALAAYLSRKEGKVKTLDKIQDFAVISRRATCRT